MMAGMYAAISGLNANQTMLNDTANNLANVNTVGYKASAVTFADSLTQVMRGAAGPTVTNGGSNVVQVGLGVQVNATANEMTEGAFQSTNNPLDVAIEGAGFLRVGQGTPPAKEPYTTNLPASFLYTRAGDLTTNMLGFLTTQAGELRDRAQLGGHRNRSGHDLRAGQRRQLHRDSARLDQHLGRPERGGLLHRREPRIENVRRTGDRGLPVAGHVRQRSGPRTSGRLAVGSDGQLRHADRRHPRNPRVRLDRSAASWRCPTSTWRRR